MILVGTQSDLREDEKTQSDLAKLNKSPITSDEGKQKAKSIKNCIKYMECSALKRIGLKDVFDEALTSVVLRPPPPAKKGCYIL